MSKHNKSAILYKNQKAWFKAVFDPKEWKTRFGKDILAEARSLDYPIRTSTFVKIRKEIITEIHLKEINEGLRRLYRCQVNHLFEEIE